MNKNKGKHLIVFPFIFFVYFTLEYADWLGKNGKVNWKNFYNIVEGKSKKFSRKDDFMYPQNYGYYPQQPIQQPYAPRTNMIAPNLQAAISQVASLKGRPVSSLEEARAMTIDFDGSIFYFPNAAENRIYTKQINPDGTSAIKTYELIETPSPIPQQNLNFNNFVTREELEKVISQLTAELAVLKQNPIEPSNPQTNKKIEANPLDF